MISECLNRDSVLHVQIHVWNITDGALVKQALAYPVGDGAFDASIHLLQTNVIVLHYDLLELKSL